MSKAWSIFSFKLNSFDSITNHFPTLRVDNIDTTKLAVSAIGITTIFSIGYYIKKQYDYEENMTPPNAQIAKHASTANFFICNNNSIIEYQQYGDPNGYPMLCFHGAGM